MGREDQIISERLRKLKELKEQGIDPFIPKYEVKNISKDLQEKYAKLKNEEHTKDHVKVAGRLMNYRDMGKIAFGDLNDGYGKIQIVLQEPSTSAKIIEFFKKYIDSGDFVGIEGTVFRTKRGELSVLVKDAQILTKSILPLPEKFHGLQDEEEKLRKRYLDILMNPEVKKRKFWNTIRKYLLDLDFLEVETPALEVAAGGAAATPFKTYHKALDLDVYLRISMGELWQKKLMVASYPKTFEIGRQFRNEGMDADHLQDYTQMEFYWAYADYEDGMKLVEEMYKKVAKEVYGKTKFKVGEHEFDLSKKWTRVDYSSTIKKETGIDIFKAKKTDIEKKLRELEEEFAPGLEKPRLIDILWKHFRRKIVGPAFLVGQPVEISPLAKRDPLDPRKVQQFQVLLAGTEMGDRKSVV